MGVVKCPNCGLKVSDSYGECFACGFRLPKQPPVNKDQGLLDDGFIEMSTFASRSNSDKETTQREQNQVNDSAMGSYTTTTSSVSHISEVSEDPPIKHPSPVKRIILISFLAVFLVALVAIGWYYGIEVPRERAFATYIEDLDVANRNISQYNDTVLAYNEQAKKVISENDNFDLIIKSAQDLIDSGDTPYEGERITVLSNTIKDARNNKVATPELIETVESITMDTNLEKAKKTDIEKASNSLIAESEEYISKRDSLIQQLSSLTIPDYSSYIDIITTQKQELEDSYAIQKQITNPAEEWVITRLGRVDNIANMAPVTEEHDPNDHLNKPGGYTSTVYFSSGLLNTQDLTGYDIIEEGTDCGGSIEVYSTVDDAIKRNDYLGQFDGPGIASSGSHAVLGTMVIRTSDELKASQQETLTNAIMNSMISLD